ncbi:MAG: hypothetical protein O3B43_01950 [Chloroflexi bacterium]|nr:hypothetical protein [Chloroflexota bacterium]
MDKETSQLFRVMLIGLAIVIAFLLWVGFQEASYMGLSQLRPLHALAAAII